MVMGGKDPGAASTSTSDDSTPPASRVPAGGIFWEARNARQETRWVGSGNGVGRHGIMGTHRRAPRPRPICGLRKTTGVGWVGDRRAAPKLAGLTLFVAALHGERDTCVEKAAHSRAHAARSKGSEGRRHTGDHRQSCHCKRAESSCWPVGATFVCAACPCSTLDGGISSMRHDCGGLSARRRRR
jgi:hypothetical protein